MKCFVKAPPKGSSVNASFVVRRNHFQASNTSGFSLIELAIVLMIISLLFVFVMPTSSVILNNRKRELTTQKLKNIETAIANFVAVNKRLPCPADGTIPPGSVGAGVEGLRNLGGDCTSSQVSGVAPWVTIGLTQADIEDGWNRRISYRASFGLTRDNALDMSSCDPAGIGGVDMTGTPPPGGKCSAACTSTNLPSCTSPQNYLIGKGFDVRDGAGTSLIMSSALYTGAAYIILSHGENGYGAYSQDATYMPNAVVGVAGSIEQFNINGPAISVASGVPATANTFRVADFSEGTAATYFDDLVISPNLFSLIQRVQLGPRSH